MKSTTASEVISGPTFSGGINVRTAGVGGSDGGGGACRWEERREGKERGRSGLCGHECCVWEAGGGRREGSVMQDLFCLSHI